MSRNTSSLPEGASAPGFAVTGIGSLPHTSPAAAVDDILALCPEYPYWPQLPRVSGREDMYRQYSADLPGLVARSATDAPRWRRDPAALATLERVYSDTLTLEAGSESDVAEVLARWELTRHAAAGLYALAEARPGHREAALSGIKGQITGPLSLGLAVTDEDGRALLYQEDLMDGVVRALVLRGRWMVRFLRGLLPPAPHPAAGPGSADVLISVDEPYLGTFGSAYFPYRPDTVLSYLRAFDGGLDAHWGVHCCANTDWEFLLASPIRFLSFDAFAYGERLSIYPTAIRAFLADGRILVWGIVPTDREALAATTAPELARRLLSLLERLVGRGVPEAELVRQSMVTPACGLAGLTPTEARRAMVLTREVSDILRSTFQGSLDNLASGGSQ